MTIIDFDSTTAIAMPVWQLSSAFVNGQSTNDGWLRFSGRCQVYFVMAISIPSPLA